MSLYHYKREKKEERRNARESILSETISLDVLEWAKSSLSRHFTHKRHKRAYYVTKQNP